VLVAEDHPYNQLLIRKLLQKFGIGTVRVVENGTAVIAACQEEDWDIILMDCHMPQMNGYDATKAIRDRERPIGKHIPIIAMTADAMVGTKDKCLRFGMDDYISKPIHIDELKQVLGQWLVFDAPAAPPPSLHAGTSEPVADLSVLRNFTEGDGEAEREAVSLLVTQSDANIARLRGNCRDGPNEAWVEAAHMLKGGMAGIGAKALSSLCAKAQDMRDAPAAERRAILESIAAEYERLKEFLRAEKLLD
jgi:CheY-like chemotaxis protein/HPt (histidine-containing phosphotransfer) domain-containing protein